MIFVKDIQFSIYALILLVFFFYQLEIYAYRCNNLTFFKDMNTIIEIDD